MPKAKSDPSRRVEPRSIRELGPERLQPRERPDNGFRNSYSLGPSSNSRYDNPHRDAKAARHAC